MRVALTRVGCRAGGRWIFRGVDLNVDAGAAVAIIGPSGVGKTTLLSAIGGLLDPTEGVRLIDGGEPRAGDYGWIFQTTNAFGNRTVDHNVLAPLLLAGVDAAAAMAATQRSIEAVGLSSRTHTKARHLSGGELQRLAIARAVARNVPLILADEPTGQLDSTTTTDVLDVLFDRREQGSTLIVCTHDHTVARRCDSVLRLGSHGLESMSPAAT